jgi:hypothetical protein
MLKSFKSVLVKQAKLNPDIFWDIDKEKIHKLSKEAILERILNYGNFDQLRIIVKYKRDFKKTYYTVRNKERNNLRPEVVNYINLYLEKYG